MKPTLSFEKTMDFVSEWYKEYLSSNKIVTSDQIFKYTEMHVQAHYHGHELVYKAENRLLTYEAATNPSS